MRDKRSVDELSIEELERVLAIKRRQSRQHQLARMRRTGRIVSAQGDHLQAAAASAGRPGPTSMLDPLPDNPASAEPARADDGPLHRQQNQPQRVLLNRLLLLVEVVAVVGLFAVGINMFGIINASNQERDRIRGESATLQAQSEQLMREGLPTIEPTPQLTLSSLVLPGGHTPPTAPDGGQFNFDEIPEHLRSLVRDQIFLPPEIQRPPVTAETAQRLIIPGINIDHSIVQGVDWEALKLGIGQHPNGTNPGDRAGNLVLAAHNDIYGEIFRHLDQLEAGDQFQVQTESTIYTYNVTGWEVVDPDAVHVMNNGPTPTATLISCYPYQVNNRRIVVYAERVES